MKTKAQLLEQVAKMENTLAIYAARISEMERAAADRLAECRKDTEERDKQAARLEKKLRRASKSCDKLCKAFAVALADNPPSGEAAFAELVEMLVQ